MPTAMPPEPLTSRFRNFAGTTTGSLSVPSIVLSEVDGILIEVVEQRMRHLLQAAFGVTFGRRRVAVDGTEITLTVDQRQAKRPGLRHAGERVINRRVAVRVVFTHHVTGDAGRILHISCSSRSAEFSTHARTGCADEQA